MKKRLPLILFILSTLFLSINSQACSVPNQPVITGPIVVCTVTTASYSATSIGATSYSWVVPSGLTITSGQGTATIVVAVGSTVNGNITCSSTNACGTSTSGTLLITKMPQSPTVINGPTTLCGMTTATYSVPPIYGATWYLWSLPSGITFTTGGANTNIGNSINVTIAPTFMSGNITVAGANGCGWLSPGTPLFLVGTVPFHPFGISGPTSVCGATTATYSVSPVIGATGYVWTVPTGMTITSGQGTTSINVAFSGFTSGTLTLAGTNACGIGQAQSLLVSVAVGSLGAITGPYGICGVRTAHYSIDPVNGATFYTWTYPSGLVHTFVPSTFIDVAYPTWFLGGTFTVTAGNACSTTSSSSLAVNVILAPGLITGPTNVCSLTSATYSILAIQGATSYGWLVPPGMTITSGAGTNSITVSIAGGTMVGGNVKVNAINSCGTSGYRALAISACASPIPIGNTDSEPAAIALSDLYPNPASDEFTIELNSDIEKQVVVEIYDVLGNRVVSEQHQIITGVNSIKTNIENYKDGVYFVRVVDGDNNRIYAERVVKQ